MNRNVLKIIAIVTMLIDHVGAYLLDSIIWFRMIGRIAMPIFAFFIAEGIRYTRSRKKYVFTLFAFAVISQIPSVLVSGMYTLNILFTFLIAISIILIIENIKVPFLPIVLCVTIAFVTYFMGVMLLVDYGLFAVLLVLVFYFVKDKTLKLLLASGVMIIYVAHNVLLGGVDIRNFIQILSLISMLIIYFYNGEKGKINLKWFFYAFYPAHLLVIYLIQLII